jgi:hypothetical protein
MEDQEISEELSICDIKWDKEEITCYKKATAITKFKKI